VLAEVFQRAAEVHARRGRDDGLRFLLDLAMEKVGCESGSVFLARLGSGDLAFAVARGPKADEILRLGIQVPMGAGIVGFCAQENVCLAVSDAEKDPRFYRRVSEAVGYATRSLLCAPITAGGRVHGAFELVNKGGGKAFDPTDLAILSCLAHEAGSFLARMGS
jgi:GAF domain-containing protein